MHWRLFIPSTARSVQCPQSLQAIVSGQQGTHRSNAVGAQMLLYALPGCIDRRPQVDHQAVFAHEGAVGFRDDHAASGCNHYTFFLSRGCQRLRFKLAKSRFPVLYQRLPYRHPASRGEQVIGVDKIPAQQACCLAADGSFSRA